jgi:hypothetical protein
LTRNRNRNRLLALATSMTMAATSLLAADNVPPIPPIKQGLWKISMVMIDAKGKETNFLAEQAKAMKSLPPAVLDMMKNKGLLLAQEDGTVLSCMTRESMDSGQWRQLTSSCTTEYKETSSSGWKWHSSCPSSKMESDGEAIFANAENYRMNMVTTRSGKVTTIKQEAKFLNSSCGDVKPLTAESLKVF